MRIKLRIPQPAHNQATGSMGQQNKISGFSLLEVLIAFLVVSVGLLGMAGLQATALRNNHSAYLRSQAVLMAYDIMDRMRANKAAAMAGSYARSFGDSKPSTTCSSICTPSQMAEADENEWVDALAKLPSGDGSVLVTSAGLATVTIRWDDNRDTSNLISFQLTTRL